MPRVSLGDVPSLHKITAKTADADWMDAGLRVEPTRPFRWIVEPGEPFVLRVSAKPKDDSNRVELTVWDWHNRPVARRTFAVPHDGELRFASKARGTYLLTFDRFAGTRHVSRLARSFSACPPNKARVGEWDIDHFFVGTCSYPDRQHWRDAFGTMHPKELTATQSAELEAELSARLGVQVTRLSAGSEENFRMYASRGVRPHLQLGHGKGPVLPKYAHVTDPKWRYPCQEAPSRAWFASVAKRFGSRAFSFEIHNEPDNHDFWRGTPEEFIAATTWALEALGTHAPKAVVTNGGYTLMKRDWYGKYLRAFRGRTTWVAFHTHNTLPHCMKLFKEHVRLHREAGYRHPVFVNTEMGMCSWRLDRDLHMAAAAIQKVLYFWAHGVRGVLLYRARDRHGPRLTFKGWGYLDHFFCPRFKYGAVAALIDWYAGVRFESVLLEQPDLHVYTFAGAGRRLAVVFDPRDRGTPSDVVLTSDATRAVVLDPMGNPTPAESPKQVVVKAGFYPVTVVFDGATDARHGVRLQSTRGKHGE